MKTRYTVAIRPAAITVALLGGLCVFLVPQAYAQGPGEHSMVTPDQLQWKDAAGLPPGTQSPGTSGAFFYALCIGGVRRWLHPGMLAHATMSKKSRDE